jgi:hypothetical protein
MEQEPKSGSSIVLWIALVAGAAVLAGAGVWWLLQEKNTSPTSEVPAASEQISETTTDTDQTPLSEPISDTVHAADEVLGDIALSFAHSDGETYIKQISVLYHPVAEFPNDIRREITTIYGQDEAYNPPSISTEINAADYEWIDLLTIPVTEPTNATRVNVSSTIFSFKPIPETAAFLFVFEFDLSASERASENMASYQRGFTLYKYDETTGQLMDIESFDDFGEYTYPKIGNFDNQGRYVTLELFDCWGCEGRQPETLLLDLETLTTKNIDRVSDFVWGDTGNYQFKEYVTVECPPTDEMGPIECSQDPATLPWIAGTFE